MSTRARVPALLITLGLASGLASGLAGCGAPSADRPAAGADPVTTTSASSGSTSTVSKPNASATTRAPETATSSAAPRPTSAGTAPEPSTHPVPRRFVCPRGGIEEAAELQRAVDQGHQPWRTSLTDVATACTFPDGAVEAVGANTYRVTRVSTGQTVIVEEAQPVRPGPGGIWVVTRVTPR